MRAASKDQGSRRFTGQEMPGLFSHTAQRIIQRKKSELSVEEAKVALKLLLADCGIPNEDEENTSFSHATKGKAYMLPESVKWFSMATRPLNSLSIKIAAVAVANLRDGTLLRKRHS